MLTLLDPLSCGRSPFPTDYDRAAQMLQPEQYPEDFPPLLKLDLLKKQAELLGLQEKFYRVPQTTRFENGPNHAGVVSRDTSLLPACSR